MKIIQTFFAGHTSMNLPRFHCVQLQYPYFFFYHKQYIEAYSLIMLEPMFGRYIAATVDRYYKQEKTWFILEQEIQLICWEMWIILNS